MEDNKITYNISTPDGRTASWTEEKWNKYKDKFMADYPDAAVVRTSLLSEDNEQDENTTYDIRTPDGRTATWDAAKWAKHGAKLQQDYPNAKIITSRRISFQQQPAMEETAAEPQIQQAEQPAESPAQEDWRRALAARTQGVIDSTNAAQQAVSGMRAPTSQDVLDNIDVSAGERMINEMNYEASLSPEEREAYRAQRERNIRNDEQDREMARLEEIAGNRKDYSRAERKEAKEQLADIVEGEQWQSRIKEQDDEALAFRDEWYQKAAETADTKNRYNPQTGQMIYENISPVSRTYEQAAKLAEDTHRILNAGSRYDSSSGFDNYIKGHADTFLDKDFWTMGLSEIERNLNLRGTFNKIVNKFGDLKNLSEEKIDQVLSDDEKALMKAFFMNADAQAMRAGDLSSGYKAGQTSAESLGFMAQFVITGGVAGATGAGVENASKALTKWIAGNIKTRALRNAAEIGNRVVTKAIVKPLAESLVRTPIMTSTYANISDGLTQINDMGTFDKTSKVLYDKVRDSVIENWSESFGDAIQGGAAALAKGLGWVSSKAIGRTNFYDFTRKMLESAPTQALKEAGFNGLISEMAEEWAGNAARVATGLMSKEEFKDFASLDQQLEMAAGFGLMSGIGIIKSSVAAAGNAKRYTELSDKMRAVLGRAGASRDEINAIYNKKYTTPRQVAEELKPYLTDIVRGKYDEKLQEDDYRTTLEFATAMGVNAIAQEAQAIAKQEARDSMRQQLQDQYGDFWHTENFGKDDIPVETVTAVTDEDGNTFYQVGEDDGKLVMRGADGQVRFMDLDEIKSRAESKDPGVVRNQPIHQYLDDTIAQQRYAFEQTRMQQEIQVKTNNVVNSVNLGDAINIGTEEEPMNAVVVQKKSDGVILQTPDGKYVKKSWNEMGNIINIPIETKTDAEMEADNQAQLVKAEQQRRGANASFANRNFGYNGGIYRFVRAFEAPYTQEDGTLMLKFLAENTATGESVELDMPYEELSSQIAAEPVAEEQVSTEAETEAEPAPEMQDNTPRDFRGEPLPLKQDEDGVTIVDENALWNKDPEAWARFNDQETQDGGAASYTYISTIAMPKLLEQRDSLNAALATEGNFDTRRDLKKKMATIDSRLAQLGTIASYYEAQFAAEAQRQQNLVEEEQNRLAKERENAILAHANELQQFLDTKADMPVSVVTLDNIAEQMAKHGAKERAIKTVQRKIALVKRARLLGNNDVATGFYHDGRVYVIAEGNPTKDAALVTFYHERQHLYNAEDSAVINELLSFESNQRTLASIVRSLSRTKEYDDDPSRILADEIIAFAIERSYAGLDYATDMRNAGASEELINVIRKEYERRLNGNNQAQGERGRSSTYDSEGNQRISESDVVNQTGESGEMGTLQQSGPDGRGDYENGAAAGEEVGPIVQWVPGNAMRAAQQLLANRSGYYKSVFSSPIIGEVDLSWGDETKGLRHIIERHIQKYKDFGSLREAIEVIDDVISNGTEIDTSDPGKIRIKKDDYLVAIAKSQEGNWVITAFLDVPKRKKKNRRNLSASLVTASQTPEGVESRAVDSKDSSVSGIKDTDNYEESNTSAPINTSEQGAAITDGGLISEQTAEELAAKNLVMDGGAVMDTEHKALKGETGYLTPNERQATIDAVNFSITTLDAWKKNYRQLPDSEERIVRALSNWAERAAADELVSGVISQGEYEYMGRKRQDSGTLAGPFRTSVEYIVTFDMDTTCPRTFQYLNYSGEIERRIGRPLTQTECIQLIEMMRAYGQQIPCVYCYAENKRQALKQYYTNFMDAHYNVIKEDDEAQALESMYGHVAGWNEIGSTNPDIVLTAPAAKVFRAWRKDRKSAYNPTMKMLWQHYNSTRDSILADLDMMLADGRINTGMKDATIVKAVAADLNINDTEARKVVADIVSEWKWDAIEGKDHQGFTRVEEEDIFANEDALALWREMTAYAKSASSAKSVLRYVPYTDELKYISAEVRDFINGMGGLRMHSSNDFRMDYVLDYFQFMADMAAAKMFGHTYTKSPDFVRIFGNSGYKINMSIAAYEDSEGNIRQNEDEGFNWTVARQLREQFPNAGTMLMATSDAQIQFALDTDWIDMFIPFHASSLPVTIWKDMRGWSDYTKNQNERFFNSTDIKEALTEAGIPFDRKASAKDLEQLFFDRMGIKRIYKKSGKSAGKRVRPHFLPGPTMVEGELVPGHNNDIQRYFELCRQYGVHPRFEGIQVRDAEGNLIDITQHPGYIKCIKETARTDTPQTAIQFNFDQPSEALGGQSPLDYSLEILRGMAEAEQNMAGKAVQDIYESTKKDPYGIVPQFIDVIIKHKEETGADYPVDFLTPDAREWYLVERKALEEAYRDVAEIPYHPTEYNYEGQPVADGRVLNPSELTEAQRRVLQFTGELPAEEENDGEANFRIDQINAGQKQPGGAYLSEQDFGELGDIRFRLSRSNRATVTNWLDKYYTKQGLDAAAKTGAMNTVIDHIDAIADPTAQICYAKWFCNGSIRLVEDDEKVFRAVETAKANKVDPMRFKSPMDILDLYQPVEKKLQPINPDTVRTLHKAADIQSLGITVYDVDEGRESMKNMREVINTHYGKASSPWCLLQGDGNGGLGDEAERFWNTYNSYPKQVAFKDGKLLAFSANSAAEKLWWDRKDNPHAGLPVTGAIQGDELGRKATFEYDNEGNLTGMSTIFKGNLENGEYTEWDDNGNISRIESHKDGKLDGRSQTFESGKLVFDEYFNNGNLVSSKHWAADGTLISETQVNDDISDSVYYYNDGTMSVHSTAKSDGTGTTESFVDGRRYYMDIVNGYQSTAVYSLGNLMIAKEERRGGELISAIKAPISTLRNILRRARAGRRAAARGNREDVKTAYDEIISNIRSFMYDRSMVVESLADVSTGEAVNFRITAEQDAEYMDAVNNGDMEKAQRMVDEAAKQWGALTDQGGNVKHMYHGARLNLDKLSAPFNVFDNTKSENRTEQAPDGVFFFTPQETVAIGYSQDIPYGENFNYIGKKYDVFLKMEAPMSVDFKGALFTGEAMDVKVLDRLSGKMVPYTNRLASDGSELPYFPDHSAFIKQYDIDHPYRGAIEKGVDFDYEELTPEQTGLKRTDDFAIEALQKGYDGIEMKHLLEIGRIISDTYAVFSSTQIKSADPVTYDDAGNVIPLSQRFNTESNDIRFRTAEQKQELFDAAKEIMGTTSNIKAAGYILPDGALLDFSGSKFGSGDSSRRHVDHREIDNYLYDAAEKNPNLRTDMNDFMAQGAIRILPESGTINVTVAPTKEQQDKLRNFVYRFGGEVDLEISGENGSSMGYAMYRRGTSATRVINDINDYFENGTLPEGNEPMFRTVEITPEVRAEMNSIKAAAQADGTFMKAPNGADTKLDEENWLKVRTKNFLNWFGDWIKAAQIQKLRKSENATITGNEISLGSDDKENKKAAFEYAKTLQGYYTNADSGLTIQLQRGRKNGGVKEVLQHDYKNREHLLSVAAIPQIIKKGIIVASEPNLDTEKNPSIKEFQHLVCGLTIGEDEYTVHALIGIDEKGDRYYDHSLVDIEKTKLLDLADQAELNGGFGTTPSTRLTTSFGYKVSDLLSILQNNSSKLVDENGEPKVFFHGTGREFYTFGNSDPASELGAGYYFTDSRKLAEWYSNPENVDNANKIEARAMEIFIDKMGHSEEDAYDNEFVGDYNRAYDQAETELFGSPRVMPVFLNVRDPRFVLEDGNLEAPKGGYDGVVDASFAERYKELLKQAKVGYAMQVMTYNNTQIKSASDNNGDFSRENDDIRFRTSQAAADILSQYENPDGNVGLQPSEVVDMIDADDDLMSDYNLADLVDRYRLLQRQNWREGMRDFAGGEMQDLFDEEILPYLQRLAHDDVNFRNAQSPLAAMNALRSELDEKYDGAGIEEMSEEDQQRWADTVSDWVNQPRENEARFRTAAKISENIWNSEFDSQYLQKLDKKVDDIYNGTATLSRYGDDPERRRGLVEGSRLLAYAAALSERAGSTVSETPFSSEDEEYRSLEQESLVEAWARHNDAWFDNPHQTYKDKGYSFYGYGQESQVYREGDNYVHKITRLDNYHSLQRLLDRIVIQNTLSPALPMEVEGFGRIGDEFVVMSRQRFIPDLEDEGTGLSRADIDEYWNSRGFKKHVEDNSVEYLSSDYIVADQHGANIIRTPWGVAVIDGNFQFNTPGEGKGGRFIFGEPEEGLAPRFRFIGENGARRLETLENELQQIGRELEGMSRFDKRYNGLQRQRRDVFTKYIETIKSRDFNVATTTVADFADDAKKIGASQDEIDKYEIAAHIGIGGVELSNGAALLISDNIPSLEYARQAYVHERQHKLTEEAGPEFIERVVRSFDGIGGREYTKTYLKEAVRAIGNTDFYDNYDEIGLAKEFVSFAMQLAYTDDNFAEEMKKKYIRPAAIDIIKELDNEQRKDNDLASARKRKDDALDDGGRNRNDEQNPGGGTEDGSPRPDIQNEGAGRISGYADERGSGEVDGTESSTSRDGNRTDAHEVSASLPAREAASGATAEDYAREEQIVRFRTVTDKAELERLNSEPTIRMYCSMTLLNPQETDPAKWELAPVKFAKVGKELRQVSRLGQWEVAEEDPNIIKSNGKVDLKDAFNKVVGNVNYNPYFHLSDSMMNDQFTGAYGSPNTVVVEVEVPESELTSGYHAEGAANSVGMLPWHSGTINAQLPADRQRNVMLSRWRKPVRVVPAAEVAQFIADKLDGTDIEMNWNLVTPSVLSELEKIGVPISDMSAGIRVQREGGTARTLRMDKRGPVEIPGDRGDGVMMRVYSQAPVEARRAIAEEAMDTDLDFAKATARHYGSLADKAGDLTDEEKNELRAAADIMARQLGTDGMDVHEAMMAMWDAGYRDGSILAEARRASVQRRLGVTPAERSAVEDVDNEIRFRNAMHEFTGSAANFYNRNVNWFWNMADEAYVDMNKSVNILVEAVERMTGRKAEGWEDIRLALNQLSSKNLADKQNYMAKYFEPLMQAVYDVMNQTGKSYEDVERYMMLKHGLERNEVFAKRDAIEYYRKKRDEHIVSIKENVAKALQAKIEQIKADYFQTDWDTEIQAAKDAAKLDQEQKIKDANTFFENRKKEIENSKYDRNAADELDSARYAYETQKKLIAERKSSGAITAEEASDQYEQNLKNFKKDQRDIEKRYGLNIHYLENRLNDYSGIMAWYVDEATIPEKEDTESEEEYRTRAAEATKQIYDNLADAEEKATEDVQRFENSAFVHDFEVEDFNRRSGRGTKLTGETDLAKALWEKINAATNENLRIGYDKGLISKPEYDHLRSMFKYYIPLMGFQEETAADVYHYTDKGVKTAFSQVIRHAKGRKTIADSPLGWIGNKAESVIQEGNKNDAKKTLYYFLQNRPDQDIVTIGEQWYERGTDKDGNEVWNPIYPQINKGMNGDQVAQALADFKTYLDTHAKDVRKKSSKLELDKGIVFVQPKAEPEHEIRIKANGDEIVMYINGNPRAAQAINGLLNSDQTRSQKFLGGTALRWLASVSTSYNPEFWISNFQRDFIFSRVKMDTQGDPAMKEAYNQNYGEVFRSTLKLMKAYKNGTLGNSRMEQYYREYADNGGITGYTVLADHDEFEEMMRDFIKSQRDGKGRTAAKKVAESIQDFAESIEQINRFAGFVAARESGKDIETSVSWAKEITANFNRKGSAVEFTKDDIANMTNRNGRKLNAFEQKLAYVVLNSAGIGRSSFLFFNAAIQGLKNHVDIIKANPAGAAKWATILIVTGALNTLLHAAMDDPDDDNNYAGISDYTRRTNLLIGGKGYYLKWAIPQEERVFYAMGDILANKFLGKSPDENAVMEIVKSFTELLPLGTAAGGDLLGTILPAQLAPIYEAAVNKNFTGSKLTLDYPGMDKKAAYKGAMRNTWPVFIKISKAVNNIGKEGDYEEIGWVEQSDFGRAVNNPAFMQHIVEGYTGGVGKTFTKLLDLYKGINDMAKDLKAGAEFGEAWGELPKSSDAPFLGRVFLNTNRNASSYVSNVFRYYDDIAGRAKNSQKNATDALEEATEEKKKADAAFKKSNDALDNIRAAGDDDTVPEAFHTNEANRAAKEDADAAYKKAKADMEQFNASKGKQVLDAINELKKSDAYKALDRKIKDEPDGPERERLLQEMSQLKLNVVLELSKPKDISINRISDK